MSDPVSSDFSRTSSSRFYNDDYQNRSKVGNSMGESGIQLRNDDEKIKTHQSPNFSVPDGPNSIF